MNKFYILLIAILVLACEQVHKSPKPDNLIDRAKMTNILYDLKLISSARSKDFKKLKDSSVYSDKYIYHKYGIDSLMLKQNLDYYATNSFKTYKEIQDEVRNRFKKEKELLEQQIKEEDSINKAKKEIAKEKLKTGKELELDKKIKKKKKLTALPKSN